MNMETVGTTRRWGAVRQTAYDDFQKALLDGRIRPGRMFSQRELVEMLGLSLGALREVLPRLQAEALVEVLPQRGIQIPPIDLPMIRDAFQMRAALEREAVVHAVRNMPTETLNQQLALHEQTVEAVAASPSDDVLRRGQEIDDQFHVLLVHATGNEILIHSHAINNIRIRLIKLDRIRLNAATLPDAFADHIAIIEALLARDKMAAIHAMDRHMDNARARAMVL